jgi:pyruvyltransferase
MEGMACYWWGHGKEKGQQNFGDIITPHLVRKLSGSEPISVLDKGGRHLCCGSILPDLKEGDIVWGSGVYAPEVLKTVPEGVRFCAVRGPLTRKLLIDKFGCYVPEVYGDPCLLIPKLFDITPPTKRYSIGIIPHMSEYDIVSKTIKEHTVIDITSGFHEVIKAVNECNQIISSSLHGLILADALGIPNVFALFSNRHDTAENYTWKFYDYFLSVNRPLSPPVDCTEYMDWTALNGGLILGYKGITFDYEKLLNACPFNFEGEGLKRQ